MQSEKPIRSGGRRPVHGPIAASPAAGTLAGADHGAVLIKRAVLSFTGLMALWLALTATLEWTEVMAGIAVAAMSTALSISHLELLDGVRLRASLPVHLARYFFRFGRALIVSNIDVARRVARPGRVLIDPALVKVHTELKSDLGRLWLANSITLTPGTLSVDFEGDMLTVHWIDAHPGADVAAATRAIAADFEDVLREIVT
jgi:multicomponent Na+:H+ antiporter subunit E